MGRTPSDRHLTPSHGSDAVKPPTPPSHLKASGKRTWKRLWEAGQVWLGPPDEPAVQAVCEQVDQIATCVAWPSRSNAPNWNRSIYTPSRQPKSH